MFKLFNRKKINEFIEACEFNYFKFKTKSIR